jgi:hypothetical protein
MDSEQSNKNICYKHLFNTLNYQKGLKVTSVLNEADLPLKVPETKWDCDKERLETAFKDNPSGINWQKFQYQI